MTTPPDPFGSQPEGYGTTPPGGYGQPAPGGYGQPAASPFGQPGGPQLASWGQRAGGAAIDYIAPGILANVVGLVSSTLGNLASLAALAFLVYNLIQQGTTGQTVGKKVMNIRLLTEATGQPVGVGLSIGRYFVHFLDTLACFVGWLFPLWDAKRQTFADKILKTVVITA